MKTSCAWLKQYIDYDWSPEDLADTLTMAGLEVEDIQTIGDLPDSVVVAKILSCEKHPNADKLSVCSVDDGSGSPLQVVCGAPNCEAGLKAVLARVGTTIGEFTIKKAKLRGVESMGMLCAEDELGLSDDHDGIMVLPDDAPIGTPLRDYYGTDTVVEWEITPNRPDWLSHIGIAREIGALNGEQLKMPDASLSENSEDVNDYFTVEVADPDLCPRYTARYIRNVTIAPSPKWMQDRLRGMGLRPINNVVDITNFVLYECGQPLHAFDADKLKQSKIIVRRAGDGEKMTTLDDIEHELKPWNLLIADAEDGVALAGVMGGATSEISDETTNVLLESAQFYPPNIRRTAKDIGISTDSSYRFERGVDFNMLEFASARAAKLICELASGELVKGMIDVKAGPYVAPEIKCRYARVNLVIGTEIAADVVKRLLAGLGLEVVCEDDESCTVAIPPHRLDLEREADLIEEIARLHGYDKIPARVPGGQVGGPLSRDDYYGEEDLRDLLLGLGIDECVHVATISEAEATKGTGYAADELVKISNPLGQEFAIMRPAIFASILAAVGRNIALGNHDLAIFEIGRAFSAKKDEPQERLECCIAVTGRKNPERFSSELDDLYDFYDLRGVVEEWFAAAGLPCPEIEQGTHPAMAKGACAQVKLNGNVVGVLGKVDASLLKDMRIRNDLYVANICMDPMLALLGTVPRYQPLSQFPSTARDVAFVASESLEHQQVLDTVAACNVDIVENVHLFDIFRDEGAIGKDKKSMAYSLTFRSPKRTLKDNEVNEAHESIKKRLVKDLGIEIRD